MAAKKAKKTDQPIRPGQSANPANNAHMRRIQAVLNQRYADEWYPVEVLDRARSTPDENGEYFTDRRIIVEALKALGEKYPDTFAPPPISYQDKVVPPEVIAHIANAVIRRLDALLENVAVSNPGVEYFESPQWGTQRASLQNDVTIAISDVVSTGNLTGDSYKFEDSEDDEDDWK